MARLVPHLFEFRRTDPNGHAVGRVVMAYFGAALLIVAAAALFAGWETRKQLKAMAGMATVRCADLTARRDQATQTAGSAEFRCGCEVTGTVEPGEHGLLTAELSKVECVWHRHVVRRRYEAKSYDSQGGRSTTTRAETVAELTSSTPFLVRDSSGAVLVDPAGAPEQLGRGLHVRGVLAGLPLIGRLVRENDGAEHVVHRFEPARDRAGALSVNLFGFQVGGDNTLGYEYEEWVLRPGTRVYVLGEASDRNGRLIVGRPSDGPFIISTRSEEELARRGRAQQRLAVIAGPVAAVAGAALLVVSLVSSGGQEPGNNPQTSLYSPASEPARIRTPTPPSEVEAGPSALPLEEPQVDLVKAAVGEPVEVAVDGEPVGRMTVTKVESSKRARADYGEPPRNGRFLYVTINVVATREFYLSALDFSFRAGDGSRYEYANDNALLAIDESDELPDGPLQAEEKASGIVVFDVPTGKGGAVIYTDPYSDVPIAEWSTG